MRPAALFHTAFLLLLLPFPLSLALPTAPALLYWVLSIVIITRNTKDLLASLLASIAADSSLPVGETIVVDNGSSDDTLAMLAENFPSVLIVGNRENRGFAAAVNLGYRRSTGDFILLLNSDTRLIPGETVKMLAYMEAERALGIVGPQLVYEDMRPQRSFALTPSLALEIFPRSLLERLLPGRFRTKGRGLSTPFGVESLIGAALLVRTAVFEALDGFDERFFFYLEETDFCMRAGREGYRVEFFPGARLIHLQGKTVKKSWVAGRIEYSISLYKFLKKYRSGLYVGVFVAVRAVKALSFLLPVTLLPFLLAADSMRRKYSYYARLLTWHLRGCPDDAGLRRPSSRG
jgi:GT2 family glycosyltransferase